jgi:hypothetical protein
MLPDVLVAAILVDEAKSIRDEVLDALERCHTSHPALHELERRSFRRILSDLHRQT